MKVIVRELGKRPVLATAARLNAPQGAKALADLMAEEEFADLCVINIDWESIPPAMVVDIIGWYKDWAGEPLKLQWPIEIEDAFGQDNMDSGILRLIVESCREEFNSKVSLRRSTGKLWE